MGGNGNCLAHERVAHEFTRHSGRGTVASQTNGIGRKHVGELGERAHNRRLVAAGKIGTAVAAREQRVANKGDVSLLGGGKQNNAARRVAGRLDNLQANVA